MSAAMMAEFRTFSRAYRSRSARLIEAKCCWVIIDISPNRDVAQTCALPPSTNSSMPVTKLESSDALGLGDGLVETIKVGQLGDVALNARNVGADCLYGLVELLLATARYEDIGTLFDEKFCRSEPNPFCSAGDDGGLAFELFSHRLSPLLLS